MLYVSVCVFNQKKKKKFTMTLKKKQWNKDVQISEISYNF